MKDGGVNMEITDNLFVFIDAVRRKTKDEKIKLNIVGKELHFFHNDDEYVIDTEVLEPNTSTCMISNEVTGNTYVLYNFKELCQALDMSSQEYLNVLQQRCFMQIEKNSFGELFIKVFCLQGTNELASDTNDFYDKRHYSVDYIHPLDTQYSFSVYNISGYKDESENKIVLNFSFRKSDFIRDMVIYCNYGGESKECKLGNNTMEFKYKPNEDIYFGKKISRSKGRCIEVSKLIEDDSVYYKDKVI